LRAFVAETAPDFGPEGRDSFAGVPSFSGRGPRGRTPLDAGLWQLSS
jgi:hypothetical protein